ncbi:hypothetical protein [Mesorhizobium sp. CAU 1732]|uniref:hypothetical protein n=1 Tax=Mesorhizobium sp. CAU 1732 TaxID=3140358 RepID=UPI003260F0DF
MTAIFDPDIYAGMKTLIAVTCLAVLSWTGYFFWGEYEAHAARESASEVARLNACQETIVAYETFRVRGGLMPDGIRGEAQFQNVAARCADALKQARGWDIVVTADGAVMN